jgi:carbon monoxide dehydrogenase subunit G
MPRATVTTEPSAAPEQIWAVLADLSRYPEWFTMHDRFITEPPAELTVGATFRQGVKIMGMPGEVAWTIDVAEAPNSIEMSGLGPMGITLRASFSIAAGDTGSSVTCDMEFNGGMLSGPLGASVEKEAKKNTEESLAKLGAPAT